MSPDFSPAISLDLSSSTPETSAAQSVAADPSATVHDVVIVGSGPAGYTAAVYAARPPLPTDSSAGRPPSKRPAVSTPVASS